MMKRVLALCASLAVPSAALATQYANVAIVAKAGGDYTHPTDALIGLATWCPNASAANRCLVKIMPGVYDLAERPPLRFWLTSYVDVEGSGASSTTLKAAGEIAVRGSYVTTAELRALTIEHTAPVTEDAIGIMLQSASVALRDLVVRVSSTGVKRAKGLQIDGDPNRPISSVLLDRVTVTVAGGITNLALHTGWVNVTVRDSALAASGGVSAYGIGATAPVPAGSRLDVTGSTIGASGGSQITYGVSSTSLRDVSLRDTSVTADGLWHSYALTVGAYSGSVGSLRADGCQLEATSQQPSAAWIYAVDAAAPLLIGRSRLTGQIPGRGQPPGNHIVCAASYNGAYAPLDAQCQPLP